MLRRATTVLEKKLAVRSMSTVSKPDYDKLGSIDWKSKSMVFGSPPIYTASDLRGIFFKEYLPLFTNTTLEQKYVPGTVEDFELPSKTSYKISIERFMGWVRATALSERREIFQYIDNNSIFIMENADVSACPDTLDFWEPPLKGWIKFNVDASFPPGEKCKPVCGFVQTSSQGLVNTSSKSLPHVTSLEHAKLHACFEALTFARDKGIKKVMVETDCAEIVGKIKGFVTTGAEDDELTYSYIWDLMKCFDRIEIQSVPPQVNSGANSFVTSHSLRS